MMLDELTTNYTTLIYSRSSEGKWIIREDGFVSNVIKRKEIVKNEIAKKRMRTKETLAAEKADYEKWNKTKRISKTIVTVTGYSLFLMLITSNAAFAQEVQTLTGGMNLIKMLQKASFWFGMGIAIWALIEMGLGSPGWKARLAKGFGLYIGAILIPYLFFEIEKSLQADVWGFIEGGGN